MGPGEERPVQRLRNPGVRESRSGYENSLGEEGLALRPIMIRILILILILILIPSRCMGGRGRASIPRWIGCCSGPGCPILLHLCGGASVADQHAGERPEAAAAQRMRLLSPSCFAISKAGHVKKRVPHEASTRGFQCWMGCAGAARRALSDGLGLNVGELTL